MAKVRQTAHKITSASIPRHSVQSAPALLTGNRHGRDRVRDRTLDRGRDRDRVRDRTPDLNNRRNDSKDRETREVNRSFNHPNDGKKDKSKNRSGGQHDDRGEVREKNHGERTETGYRKHHDMKLTPLNIRLTDLYEKISKDLSPPRHFPAEIRDKRDKSKYYNYHKDIGHNTENCLSLKIEVQRMIDAGKLQVYMKKGFSESGNGAEIMELGYTKIEFSEADMIGVYAPHNDVIVITTWIGMFRVHCILVGTRSSVSVLFS
ncbi:serine/threonine-protein kinase fray2-like [Papaver somniferum]|uniref:serine/threonine-protein kinase fray2-like n=1 Tax=Papaver somniferum TaxID=3469 RepID=UPI000E6FBFD0|nr:serine/threonine-protein kinase fray2-like [Papaver somniferum]